MMGSIPERILDGTKLPLLIVRPQGHHVQAPGEPAEETATAGGRASSMTALPPEKK